METGSELISLIDTAKLPAAGPVTAHNPGLVSHPDLPHLNPCTEYSGKLTYKLAEIYPASSETKLEYYFCSVEKAPYGNKLHAEVFSPPALSLHSAKAFSSSSSICRRDCSSSGFTSLRTFPEGRRLWIVLKTSPAS